MEHPQDHSHEKEQHPKKDENPISIDPKKAIIGLVVIVILIGLFNVVQLGFLGSTINQKVQQAAEQSIPPTLQITMLSAPGCLDCKDLQPIMDGIKGAGYNITEEHSFNPTEAKTLIEKYNITMLPTIVVLGEVDRAKLRQFEARSDALVFTGMGAPYLDVTTNQVIGHVKAQIITASACLNCTDLGQIVGAVKQEGVTVTESTTYDLSDARAQELMTKYHITSLPAVVFSKDLAAYSNQVTQNWDKIGSVETDGSFVSRLSYPPYFDVSEKKTKGIVDMTVLADKSCVTCFEPDTFHKPILQRMGVFFGHEKRIDVASAEGKSIVARYKITDVPTILLTGDVESYPVLTHAWTTVGDVATDGTYVFRNMTVIEQPYRDLSTGKIVEPVVPAPIEGGSGQTQV